LKSSLLNNIRTTHSELKELAPEIHKKVFSIIPTAEISELRTRHVLKYIIPFHERSKLQKLFSELEKTKGIQVKKKISL